MVLHSIVIVDDLEQLTGDVFPQSLEKLLTLRYHQKVFIFSHLMFAEMLFEKKVLIPGSVVPVDIAQGYYEKEIETPKSNFNNKFVRLVELIILNNDFDIMIMPKFPSVKISEMLKEILNVKILHIRILNGNQPNNKFGHPNIENIVPEETHGRNVIRFCIKDKTDIRRIERLLPTYLNISSSIHPAFYVSFFVLILTFIVSHWYK